MKKGSKKTSKALDLKTQFVRAFQWLQANAGVKTAKDLADMLQTSPTTISELINNKRDMTGEYAYRMNELLEKHKLTLKDFDTDYLNKQAGLASRKSKQEAYESLVVTKILTLEGGMEAALEKLSIIEKSMGELLKLGELLKKQQTK